MSNISRHKQNSLHQYGIKETKKTSTTIATHPITTNNTPVASTSNTPQTHLHQHGIEVIDNNPETPRVNHVSREQTLFERFKSTRPTLPSEERDAISRRQDRARGRGVSSPVVNNRANVRNVAVDHRPSPSNSTRDFTRKKLNIVSDLGGAIHAGGKIASTLTTPIRENQARENPVKTINDIPAPESTQNQQDAKNQKNQSIIGAVEGGLAVAGTIASLF